MREVLKVLDALGIDWFVTGSEAAACYGVLRQTFDTDVVIDLKASEFDRISGALPGYAIAAPVEFADFAMASVISTKTAAKVDLIMRQPGPYARRTLERRARCEHRELGEIWVASLEDLVVAKLEWSEGVSELQLRDCGQLLRLNQASVDWPYLVRTAAERGVSELLDLVRNAP
ncbi:MAG: hypothetical protein ACR2GO_01500 [Candidatus Limnocylindria bacterium]